MRPRRARKKPKWRRRWVSPVKRIKSRSRGRER